MEYGRFILLVVAAIGWLFASLFAFVIVALFGFFGVGFFGLLIWFISTQAELGSEGGTSPTTRFLRNVGIGLTLVGFGGFLHFQLGLFAP